MEVLTDLLLILATIGHLSHMTAAMELKQSHRGTAATNQFENLVVNHKKSGDVFIGALNKLLRFSSRLLLLETVRTGPQEDNPNCPPYIISTYKECKTPKFHMNSYSKGLVIDYDNDMLISCSSLYHGSCDRRHLENITVTANHVQDDRYVLVPNDQMSSSVIFIAPGVNQQKALYIASTFTTYGDMKYRTLVPALSSRKLTNFKYSYQDKYGKTMKKILEQYRKTFVVTYIYGFHFNGFIYIITVQPESIDKLNQVTKLIRVCAQDIYFNTYVEIPLECTKKDMTYNRAQGAVIDSANSSLYVAFIKSMSDSSYTSYTSHTPTPSAVCVFDMSAVEQEFDSIVKECYNGIGKLGPPHIVARTHCPDEMIKPDMCGENGTAKNYSSMSSTIPIKAKPILTSQEAAITAITMATVHGSPVLFLGTAKGTIQKAVPKLDGNFTVFDEVVLHSGMAVNKDMALSPDNQFLYAMTSSKIGVIDVSTCTPHPNCESCVATLDPYCGWCVTDNTCSKKSKCAKSSVTPSWLPASKQKCPTIDDLRPSALSVEVMEGSTDNKISLQLKNVRVAYRSSQVKCHFFGGSLDQELAATVGSDERITCPVPPLKAFPPIPPDSVVRVGRCHFLRASLDQELTATVGSDERITCPMPPLKAFPPIPPDSDHVNVELRLMVAGRFLTKHTVSLYDCSINTGCKACTETRFMCKWCSVTHTCLNPGATTCTSADGALDIPLMRSSQQCPVIETPHTDIVVHSGEGKEISVESANMQKYMYEPAESAHLKCHFTQAAEPSTVKATYTGRRVYCDRVKFLYSDDEKPYVMSEFKVTWGVQEFPIDNPNNVQVRIYKCPLMVTNCGKCLTMDEQYACGWCADSSCTLNKHCTTDFLDRTATCPGPQIIRFNPTTGPVGGKTNISVTGINLGKKVRDIQGGVTVAGLNCVVEGENYEASSGFVCETHVPKEPTQGQIKVTVSSREETVSRGEFSFVKPQLHSITPRRGPVSGGTTLTIIGTFMDSGSSTAVKVGNNSCKVLRRDMKTITCITSSKKSHGNVEVWVNFGGAKQRVPMVYTYVPDPTIVSVDPTTAIPSGGTTVNVVGTNFDVIDRLRIILYIDSLKLTTPCERQSNSILKCSLPVLPPQLQSNLSKSHPREVHYGFIMDQVPHLEHVSERPRFKPLLYYPDPHITPFKGDGPDHLRDDQSLTIKGDFGYLNPVRADFYVYVGESLCKNVTLYQDAISCQPPVSPGGLEDDGRAAIRVRVGNHESHVGYLHYYRKSPSSDKPIALGVILGVVLPILLIVTLLTICVVRRHMKTGGGDNLRFTRPEDRKEQEILLNHVKVDYSSKETQEYVNGLIAGLQDDHLEQSAREIIIDRNKIDIGPVIGKGFYGTVYRAELQSADDLQPVTVAVKILNGKINGNSNLHLFIKEAIAVKDFTHPNILSLIGVSLAPYQLPLIVLPFMPHADVKTFIKDDTRKLKVHDLLVMAEQICHGMEYLSQLRFVHRNLAARNCLVCEGNVIVISDYGLTKDLFSDDYLADSAANASPLKWRAPETLERYEFSSQSDVWTFGVVMWELVTRGVTPYPNIQPSALQAYLAGGQRLNKPKSCPLPVYDIMTRCWAQTPSERPDFHTLTTDIHTLSTPPTATPAMYANVDCAVSTEFLDVVV